VTTTCNSTTMKLLRRIIGMRLEKVTARRYLGYLAHSQIVATFSDGTSIRIDLADKTVAPKFEVFVARTRAVEPPSELTEKIIWGDRIITMIIGDPSILAIESSITEPYARMSQRALGFFVLHIRGQLYGVHSSNATLLAYSFDAVRRRISHRGKHFVPFDSEPDALKIAEAVRTTLYDESRQDQSFLGMSADVLREAMIYHEIIWAPDGDTAFDDGSHVLQFDQGDRVRLIAFKNTGLQHDVASTLSEVFMDIDEFYELLNDWQYRFEAEWVMALRNIQIKPAKHD